MDTGGNQHLTVWYKSISCVTYLAGIHHSEMPVLSEWSSAGTQVKDGLLQRHAFDPATGTPCHEGYRISQRRQEGGGADCQGASGCEGGSGDYEHITSPSPSGRAIDYRKIERLVRQPGTSGSGDAGWGSVTC